MILDLIFAVLIIMAFIIGIKKGLVKWVWSIAAWILTIVVVCVALTPAVNFLHGTAIAENIHGSLYDSIAARAGTDTAETENMLPNWIENSSFSLAAENAAENAVNTVTDVVIKIIAAVGLFILVRIVLGIVFRVLDGASKLPVINGANKLLGGVFSAVNMLLCIYLAAAAFTLFADPAVYEYINDTYIVKYLFNNNILMNIIMKL